MIGNLLLRLLDGPLDEIVSRMMTDDYSENLFLAGTIVQKLSLRAMVEASLRAQTGEILSRPIGSFNVQSPWEKLFLNPRQLFQLPTPDEQTITSQVTIGPGAKKPLTLSMPIMVSAMSYGGSLSLPAKIALARGASLAGTATNTGESALSHEERDAAKLLVGQYNRGEWMNTPEQLRRLDAIEVQLGQGAFGGAVYSKQYSYQIGDHLRATWHLKPDQDTAVKARLTDVNTPEDVINLLNSLKSQYDVPIGIKIAATHFLEEELEVITQSSADYIVIDGAEGGTAVAPPTLEDDLGLPTLYALNRASKFLEEEGVRDRFSLIATGGLTTPGHFLKCLALGADAVYISSIALIALIQTQMAKALTDEPPVQLVIYGGKLADKFEVDEGARTLSNFLNSCAKEMLLAAQATGKTSLSQFSREDLVATDPDLARVLGVGYAGEPSRKTKSIEDLLTV
jgi:glutamate synthase domain-containing protein 2